MQRTAGQRQEGGRGQAGYERLVTSSPAQSQPLHRCFPGSWSLPDIPVPNDLTGSGTLPVRSQPLHQCAPGSPSLPGGRAPRRQSAGRCAGPSSPRWPCRTPHLRTTCGVQSLWCCSSQALWSPQPRGLLCQRRRQRCRPAGTCPSGRDAAALRFAAPPAGLASASRQQPTSPFVRPARPCHAPWAVQPPRCGEARARTVVHAARAVHPGQPGRQRGPAGVHLSVVRARVAPVEGAQLHAAFLCRQQAQRAVACPCIPLSGCGWVDCDIWAWLLGLLGPA